MGEAKLHCHARVGLVLVQYSTVGSVLSRHLRYFSIEEALALDKERRRELDAPRCTAERGKHLLDDVDNSKRLRNPSSGIALALAPAPARILSTCS